MTVKNKERSGGEVHFSSKPTWPVERTFRMPPMPSLFIKAVKDICTINTFELLNILFSEVNCLHFGFTTRLFPDATNDLSIYEV